MDWDLSPLSKRKKSVKWPHELLKIFQKSVRTKGKQRRNSENRAGRMFVYDEGKGWSRCSRNSEVMVAEKGARKAFEKLVSEDSWNERVKCKLIFDLINFW